MARIYNFFVAALALAVPAVAEVPAAEPVPIASVVGKYCTGCHDAGSAKGRLNLADILKDDTARHPDTWEKVIRKLQSRQMPPEGRERPSETEYDAVASQLAAALDRAAAAKPRPGRTETFRRLNRTEYQNAIRDLLALEIDAAALLPADEASHGFDNVTMGQFPPTLIERFITAAQKISRLAVGGSRPSPGGDTFRVRPDITQEERVDGLPIGTRGGALLRYTFPQDGDYDVQVRLARDRNEHVEGLREPHDLELLLDRRVLETFTVKPPPGGEDFEQVDAHLKVRMAAAAGPHDLGVTFVKDSSSVLETLRQPYNAHFNTHRHPRISPAVYQISITGPFHARGPGDTPSRRRIFIVRPSAPDQDEGCARQVLGALARRAYRRPVDKADVDRLMTFYLDAWKDSGFEAGIESAMSALLVSREFLFRVEQQPAGLAPETAYPISNIDLASRLSFFLWSSLPDDELLAVAERGELSRPAVLEQQTRRMLADARSESLVHNFASQWLYLRNLASITPDGRLYPDFDDNLRQAFRRETELLFEDVLRDDPSVLRLLKSDQTWLNERLAKHYGIPHVYGTRFRRVPVTAESERGGLLRHGSILTVTSYATRTSPVLRGKWILDNLLGSPPPPPLPDVPALDDNPVSAELPVRERLLQHRASPACSNCHRLMDPVGFALENFDAVGRWRTTEAGTPV